jgi:hypothetical protein
MLHCYAIQQSVVTDSSFTLSYTAVCSDGPKLHCYAIQLPVNCSTNLNDNISIVVTQFHSNVWSVLFPRRDVSQHISDNQLTNKTEWLQIACLLRLVVQRSSIAHRLRFRFLQSSTQAQTEGAGKWSCSLHAFLTSALKACGQLRGPGRLHQTKGSVWSRYGRFE